MVGAGWFAGVGANGVVGTTDGPLDSCSTSQNFHFEANIGSLGAGFDINQDSGSVSYSGRPFTGIGFGAMAAGGIGTSTTYATPTVSQIINSIFGD